MEQINRPTFLTILCILTFVGSGMGVFSAISNYTNAEMAAGVTEEAMDTVLDDMEDRAETEKEAALIGSFLGSVTEGLTTENIRSMGIASGIASVLTLIGAVLMWGLNRKGFWLYLIGTSVAIIAPMIIYEGLLGIMAGGGMAFIGVIFCVLYGINLKHMNA